MNDGLDEARLEWEFERLRDAHQHCCVGALLCTWADGSRSWLNVLEPVDDPNYRAFVAATPA